MVGSLCAVGGSNSGVLLGVSDEVINGGETVVVSADENQRSLGDVVADSLEVGSGVGAETLDDGRVEVRQVHEADGHAVGISRRELGPAEGAGAAVNVLDNDSLADVLLGVLGEDAGGNVSAVAGLVGNDHGDGAVGSPAGAFGRSSIGSSVSCGSLSRCGSGGLAAGAECKYHAESKDQCKYFFHFYPPVL